MPTDSSASFSTLPASVPVSEIGVSEPFLKARNRARGTGQGEAGERTRSGTYDPHAKSEKRPSRHREGRKRSAGRAAQIQESAHTSQNEALAPAPETAGTRLPTLARNLSRRLVSEPLYRALVAFAPSILTEPAAARFVLYGIFGTFRGDAGRPVLVNSLLADCAGVPLRGDGRWARGHRWESGDAFLDWLRAHVLPGLDVSGFNGAAGYARELRSLGLPPDLDAMIASERSTPASERGKAVDPVSGRPVGKRRQEAVQAAVRGDLASFAAAIESDRAPEHPATRLMHYMNGRSPRLLANIVTPAKLSEARAKARAHATEGERNAALGALDWVESRGTFQPYKTTANSVRIVPALAGLNGMWIEGRETLLADPSILKVDLAKAQLAINATLYNITALSAALRAGKISWDGMLREIGADVNPATLAAVKRAVYGLAYGGSDNGTVWRLTGINPVDGTNSPTGITRAQALAFLALPLVSELRVAMGAALASVERNGGARDAFGDWIGLDFVRANLERKGDTETDPARSVLAQVAQSWEVLLMTPITNLAILEGQKAMPDFQIAVWLWDGAYIKTRRAGDAERIGQELKRAVDRHAETLGIPTFLEVG